MKTIEIYQSGSQHRWRLLASNGNNCLNPGESYKRRGTMTTQIMRTLRLPYQSKDVKDGAVLKGYDANGRFIPLYKVRFVAPKIPA